MNEEINAITLVCTDMATSVAFYLDLGLTIAYGGSEASFTSLRIGANFVNLQHTGDVPGTGWGRVIFHVGDPDAVHATAAHLGHPSETEPADAPWGERYFHILDPDGHELRKAAVTENARGDCAAAARHISTVLRSVASGLMSRRRITSVLLALAIPIVAFGCGDENFFESQLRIEVVNNGAETVYWVKAGPDATANAALVDGPHQPVPGGTSSSIAAGGVEVDPGNGGCFRDEQVWLVRSLSGTLYDVDPVPSIGDVEIVQHWPPSTCFDESDARFVVG